MTTGAFRTPPTNRLLPTTYCNPPTANCQPTTNQQLKDDKRCKQRISQDDYNSAHPKKTTTALIPRRLQQRSSQDDYKALIPGGQQRRGMLQFITLLCFVFSLSLL